MKMRESLLIYYICRPYPCLIHIQLKRKFSEKKTKNRQKEIESTFGSPASWLSQLVRRDDNCKWDVIECELFCNLMSENDMARSAKGQIDTEPTHLNKSLSN